MTRAKPPSLRELQRELRRALTHPGGVRRALGEPGTRGWSWNTIEQTPALPRDRRLAIYGDGYFARLSHCLGNNFPCLRAVLGPGPFHALARAYLVKHPSTFPCIDDVGADLPAFLRRRPETKQRPFLPDLAALEWAYHQSFYANDRPPFDPRSLKKIPPEKWTDARVTVDDSVRLLRARPPVLALWRADGRETRRRKRTSGRLQSILVYRRPDGLVRVSVLGEGSFGLLAALRRGDSLGEALARLPAGRHAANVQRWFADWMALGLIRDVVVST